MNGETTFLSRMLRVVDAEIALEPRMTRLLNTVTARFIVCTLMIHFTALRMSVSIGTKFVDFCLVYSRAEEIDVVEHDITA